ncbi:MAG: 5'/3'-nucleotidase SurE [Caldilineaceae bacterium]|nr:5'/3'-nucleotidase SurE [Caldilineaceae bacterium]HRJ41088.1 5'/3'-nucleotidase SurE [Caldilineaceae bacterium]
MPNILVTNDDGVNASGIQALAKALDAIGSVTVIAPERNWSAAGHPKTLHKPLRLTPLVWPDGRTAYASSGAPSDCVALGLLGAVDMSFDLVVSGINSAYNLGTDVFYSGTVAAAMESIINGVAALAVSLGGAESGPASREAAELAAAAIAAEIALEALTKGLPANTLLNINLPRLVRAELRGVQSTRLGRRVYRDVLDTRMDPWGRPYYWFGGEIPTGIPEDGSDIGAVENGYVSVTPLGIDLTSYPTLALLEGWRFPGVGA